MVKTDTLTSLLYFQQNCQIAETLISTHLMLFQSMKQSPIISATGHFQVKLFATEKITISLGKLKAFEFSTFMTANTYQTYYKFPESEIQGLLNLVRE